MTEYNDIDLFFHEDFFCQIELVPKENCFHIKRTFESFPEAIDKNGFNSCIVRPEHPISVAEKQIPFKAIKAVLDSTTNGFYANVYSGYGNNKFRIKDAFAWDHNHYGIFVQHNNQVVERIWLWYEHQFVQNNNGEPLCKALNTLGNRFSLILADWNRELAIDLSSTNKISAYLTDVLLFDTVIKS